MATHDIKIAYANAQKDISGLLGFFEVELDKDRPTVTRLELAEIHRARQLMINALSAMSGMSVGDIKLELDEMNL